MPKSIIKIAVIGILLATGLSGKPARGQDQAPDSGGVTLYFPIVMNYLPVGWIGPDGGNVIEYAVDPLHLGLIYAATYGSGVFKSSDGGANWSAASQGMSLSDRWVNSIAISASNPQILFAGIYKGVYAKIYKTTDGGQSWFKADSGIQDPAVVYALAVDPKNPNVAYAATRGAIVYNSSGGITGWNGVLYRTTDGGASWSSSLTDIGGSNYDDWVYSIAIDPSNTANVYAAAHENGVYKSTNGGSSWSKASSGLPTNSSTSSVISGRSIVVDPHNPQTVYVGLWHNGVFKSTDAANNWTSVGPSGVKIYPNSLSINPKQTNTLFFGDFPEAGETTGLGVWMTTTGGNNWLQVGLQDYSIYTTEIDPFVSTNVFAGPVLGGVYRSTDSGISWAHSQAGFKASVATGLIVLPADSRKMVAGILGGGVERSDNAGQTWSDIPGLPGSRNVHAVALSPSDANSLFVLTDSGVFTLDLSTSTWTQRSPTPLALKAPLSKEEQQSVRAAAEELYGPQPDGVLDSGFMQPTSVGVPGLSIAFAPSNPSIAYLGTSGGGLYRSQDGGATWSPWALSGKVVLSTAVKPDNPNVLYASTSDAGVVQYYNGSSWQSINFPGGGTVNVLIYSDPSTVWAGSTNGVYKRVGSGSWTAAGLSNYTLRDLTLDPHRAGRLWAGTSNGAFYSDDGGITWQNGPADLAGRIILKISFDPNSPDYVYFATDSFGAYRALDP